MAPSGGLGAFGLFPELDPGGPDVFAVVLLPIVNGNLLTPFEALIVCVFGALVVLRLGAFVALVFGAFVVFRFGAFAVLELG